MRSLKLFMLLLGCRPKGRHTEQHDIFFGIGYELKDLIKEIKQFWPEAKGNIHIDAWREVTAVDGHTIRVTDITTETKNKINKKLFFINLGGYKEDEFDEHHYTLLVVADNKLAATNKAKQTAFYKHTSLADNNIHYKALSHIDDRYGIDVDELYDIKEILPAEAKEKYTIKITSGSATTDLYHLGYTKLNEL
jgi:Domain of Unknown Function (DUF1543)